MNIILLLVTGLLLVQGQDLVASVLQHCPAGCRCIVIKNKANTTQPRSTNNFDNGKSGPIKPRTPSSSPGLSSLSGSKVRCGDIAGQVASLDELKPSLFPRDTVQLDLADNLISSIPKAGFAHLPLLQKLDLKDNLITHLSEESFSNLTNLRRLDLSGNGLTRLSGGVFLGLEKLIYLRIAQNKLTSIAEGTFDDLIALKNLDLSSNPLLCDCHLAWLVDWLGNESVKLSDGSQCSNPPHLQGQKLSSLASSSLLCRTSPSTVTQTTLEMHPESDQVVFERDTLRISCEVTGPSRNSGISWVWQGRKDPTLAFPDLKVDTRFIAEQAATISSVSIGQLSSEHSGRWECSVGNLSHSLSLLVISASTQFCPQTVTSGNKGSYTWPRSVVGTLVELPCAATPPTPLAVTSALARPGLVSQTKPAIKTTIVKPIGGVARASQLCGQNGVWQELNTSTCAFLSDTTKALEQFAKLSLNKATALQSAQRLRNFTGDLHQLSDRMDVVFLARTIENHLEFLTREKELGPLLLGVVGASTLLPSALLAEAQQESGVGERLVTAAEVIAEHSPVPQSQPGVAVEALRVSRDGFQGVTCVWYADPQGIRPRLFHCSSNERTLPSVAALQDMEMVGSMQLPASLFLQLPKPPGAVRPSLQLIVSMFANGRLFPETNSSLTWGVTSCVIGCKLVGGDSGPPELDVLSSAPVWVTLRAPLDSAARPVVWDGRGSWSEKGCTFSRTLGSLVVFQCSRLGYFALKQDLSPPFMPPLGPPPLPSRPSPPALYAASILLGISLLIAMTTYMTCHKDLHMPAKTKHSLVNTWLAMLLLSLTFSCGIYQTGHIYLCQGVGITLHYLSLCCLLWMTVTISNLHKQLTAGDYVGEEDEEPGELPVPSQPMLGFYLVGWGIALIICGISGAVNLRHYAGSSICFLGPAASVSAVLVPGGAILAVLTLLWLLANCAAGRHNSQSGRTSQGTQATERVDLELLGPRPPSPCLSNTSSKCSEDEDAERSPRSQLLAHLTTLMLFQVCWMCGAAAILPPMIPHQGLIFSCLHAVSCAALGLFILSYFCIGRRDVTTEWKLATHLRDWWCAGSGAAKMNVPQYVLPPPREPVSRPPPTITIPAPPPILQTDDETAIAKSCLLEEDEEDERAEAELLEQVCKLRALVLPPASVVTEGSVSGAEVFYNPHQLGVARKFFRRQRLMKRNNAAAAATSCAATSDAESLFSTGSKVNNTNIHTTVPHNSAKLNNRVNLNRDPNLLSHPPDFTTHHNVFERPPSSTRGQSPLSSVSEARAIRSRRPHRARSADELGDHQDQEDVKQRASSRHRARRRHRRGGRAARVNESSVASVTSLRSKPLSLLEGDSDTKKETCV